MNRIHRLSLHALVAALAIASAVAIPVVWSLADAGPIERRASWCPTPEDRVESDRSLTRAQMLARLREIRTKFGRLHEGELFEQPDDAPGSVAELDRLLMTLITDYDLATTPTREARP